MNPSPDDQNDELTEIFDTKLFKDGTIHDKLIKQAYHYYCKAMRYYRLNEIDGALVNFLLALNNLYNLKKTFKSAPENLKKSVSEAKTVYSELNPNQKCSSLAVINDIDQTIKKIISYVSPLQEQLRKIKNYRGSNCDENKDDDVECVDVKAKLADKKEDMLTFKNISGQESAKENIRNGILNPILYPRLFPNLSKGILFYGPPGTGKTLLAKAFVNELQIEALRSSIDIRLIFYAPKGSDLKGKYVGESEKKIRNWFKCAHTAANDCKTKLTEDNKQNENVSSSNVLSIIFIDEIEAIAGNRDDDPNGIMTTTVNALLQEMDGVESYPNVIVMAATNYPWKLDGAILRRFDTKIYVSLPTEDDIASLIKSQIYFDFIKPALKKPKDLTKKEEAKKTIVKGDLKCGDRDSVSLIKYQKNDDPKPEQLFDYFRNKFFPQLTDRFIKNFSKGLSQHNYSGGDVKNVLRYVFKTMGKRAIDQNVFTDTTMVNPETLRFNPIQESFHKNACNNHKEFTFKLFSRNGYSDSLERTDYKKAILLTDSNKTPDDKKKDFNIFTRRSVSQELLDRLNYVTIEDLFLGDIDFFTNKAYDLFQLGRLFIHIDYIPRLFEKMADYFMTYYLEHVRPDFYDVHKNIRINQQFVKDRFVEMYDVIYHICELSHDESHKHKYLNLKNLMETLVKIINYDEKKIAIDLLIEVQINGYPEDFKNLSNKIWVSTQIAGDELTQIIQGKGVLDHLADAGKEFLGWLASWVTSPPENKTEIPQPLKLNETQFRCKLFDEFTKYQMESNTIRNKIFRSTKNIYCIEENRHIINEPMVPNDMKKDEIVYIFDLKGKEELKFNGKFGKLLKLYKKGVQTGNWNVLFQDGSNHDIKLQNIRRTVQYNRISNMIIRKSDYPKSTDIINTFLECLSTGTIDVKKKPFNRMFTNFIHNINTYQQKYKEFLSKYFTLNSLYSLSGTMNGYPDIVKDQYEQYAQLHINPIIILAYEYVNVRPIAKAADDDDDGLFDFVSNLTPDDDISNIMYDIEDEPVETKKKGVRKMIEGIIKTKPDINKNYQAITGDMTEPIYDSSGYYVKVGKISYALYTVPYSPMMKDQTLHGGNGNGLRNRITGQVPEQRPVDEAARAASLAEVRRASPPRAEAEAERAASAEVPIRRINPVRVISKIDGNPLFFKYLEDANEWKIDSSMFLYDEKDTIDLTATVQTDCIEEIENFRKITLSFVPYDFTASIDPRRTDSVRAAASKDIIDDLNNYVINPQLREDNAKERDKKAREESKKKEQEK